MAHPSTAPPVIPDRRMSDEQWSFHDQEFIKRINKTITCSCKGQATTRSLVPHSQDRDHSRRLGNLDWLVGRRWEEIGETRTFSRYWLGGLVLENMVLLELDGGRPLYIGTVDFQIRRSYYSSQERLEFRLETFCILWNRSRGPKNACENFIRETSYYEALQLY